MTYEEKLDLILKAIIEAQKATINGQSTKLYIKADNGLETIGKDEVRDILLKLQLEDNVLKINDMYNRLLSIGEQPKNLNYLLLDINRSFDSWYESRLMSKKTDLENIDFINMLRIYDVVLDINEQIQLTNKTNIHIPLIPAIIRFSTLFPADTAGIRDQYCENRLRSLNYLKSKNVITDYSYGNDGWTWDTIIKITFKLSSFDDFYKTIQYEYIKRNKINKETENPKETITETKQEVKITKVVYDPKKGELNIEDKIVKLKKDSFRAKLLELLLKDNRTIKKEWSWDEVIEKIEGTLDLEVIKEKKGKFYPACDGLSKFIAQKIGVNDLLIFNKSTVQINFKYL